jgi:arylsulfatase A-like enzyme
MAFAGAAFVFSACATTKPPAASPVLQEEAPPPPGPASQATVAPRLVVLIVIDQLGQWVLDEHMSLLPKSGAIRRAYREGAALVAEYPYASTQTAPGHASLATGVTPAVHGIVSNEVYDPGLGARPIVDDREHVVIGNPERFVSPSPLRSETVADVLYRQSKGKARIVGLSMKARSAVLSVGHKPDIAVFYDAKYRAMTTSTYYAPSRRLPDWLNDFNEANPVGLLLLPWQPAEPSRLERVLGPDGRAGEMYPLFPHDPREAPDPWYAFSATPESSEYLIAAAYAAVKAERMGVDEIPDLLAISISGTDIVGHIWGARSWEYADNLARVDRALTQLVDLLQARGPVAFVLTADHGVAELPEQSRDKRHAGGRLRPGSLVAEAERAADETLGPGHWIAGYVPPLFTYTLEGKARREELTSALQRALPAVEGVLAVYDAHAGPQLRQTPDPIEQLVGASLPDDPPGDLYLVAKPGWFDALSEDGGTNHGSPWEYDRRVPVLMWGTAIERHTSNDVYDALQVATSLAALLNVAAPEGAPPWPLPGVMHLPD